MYLLDENLKLRLSCKLKGVKNRDWEDIASGPGPQKGRNYLYIGDIGDNLGRHDHVIIYRIPEPSVGREAIPFKVTARDIAAIQLNYPDGARDAETLLSDPHTGDLYIISKREHRVGLYRAPYPQSTAEITTLQKLADLPYSGIVGGDISPDGGQLLLKTYTMIYYWRLDPAKPLTDILREPPLHLPYEREPQGEAIAWDFETGGYYTISEKAGNRPVYLFSYEPQKTPDRDMNRLPEQR